MAGTQNKSRSLERQITTQDIDCLREAFALFDINRKEEITTEELGKVSLCKFEMEDMCKVTLIVGFRKPWLHSI